MPTTQDALERTIELARPAQRVVSLVPSLTETVALFDKADTLIGCTRYCCEPADVVDGLRKIGGTKDPDVEAILALEPDLVLANKEENRQEDVEALIDAGLAVYVGFAETARQAATEMEGISTLLGTPIKGMRLPRELVEEVDRQEELNAERPPVRVFCPIWRKPYMAVSGATYAGDILRLAGGTNVCESHRSGARYPQVSVAELESLDPQVILLPSEPFHFRERHRDEFMALRLIEAVAQDRVFLIDGLALTWYGPRATAALREVAKLLDRARPEWTPPEDPAAKPVSGVLSVPPSPSGVKPRTPAPRTKTPTAGKKKAAKAPPRKPRNPTGGAQLPPGLRLNVTRRDVVDEKG